MLTVITGTPGAGKTLYAVWERARAVPGSTCEATEPCVSHGVSYAKGDAVPRHLFSNIKGLLVEHQHITAADLETWHEWAQPGDVILFDEVQEVWRPRGLGTKVPECIAALETHRHKGVDIVLVTQHPMLVDPNIRRLVNQHLHLRRLARIFVLLYEWDHCSNPGMVKTCLQRKVWRHPKEAYGLYKSAQLHTRPTAGVPKIALLGLVALAGLAVAAPIVKQRMEERFASKPAAAATSAPVKASPAQPPAQALAAAPAPAAPFPGPSTDPAPLRPVGCIASASRCSCFGPSGEPMDIPVAQCREDSSRVRYVLASTSGGVGSSWRGPAGTSERSAEPVAPASSPK